MVDVEGVRYGWLIVSSFSKPWTITSVRLVCQVKPTPYTAALSLPLTTWPLTGAEDRDQDDHHIMEKIFWTAAYTLRLNLMEDYFGSILEDRGDRYSWTGDAHVEQVSAP